MLLAGNQFLFVDLATLSRGGTLGGSCWGSEFKIKWSMLQHREQKFKGTFCNSMNGLVTVIMSERDGETPLSLY